jgi:hypothetical protein
MECGFAGGGARHTAHRTMQCCDRHRNVACAAIFRSRQAAIDVGAQLDPRESRSCGFASSNHEEGLRQFPVNWQVAARWLFERVSGVGRARRRRKDQGIAQGIARLLRCEERVEESYRVALHARVIPLSLVKGDRLLNYFSMVTTVGTPQTVAAQEMCIECLFRRTRRPRVITSHHIALMSAG